MCIDDVKTTDFVFVLLVLIYMLVRALIPQWSGELEWTDTRCGKSKRVPVGDLLHRAIEALNVVSFQHQHRLARVHMDLQTQTLLKSIQQLNVSEKAWIFNVITFKLTHTSSSWRVLHSFTEKLQFFSVWNTLQYKVENIYFLAESWLRFGLPFSLLLNYTPDTLMRPSGA